MINQVGFNVASIYPLPNGPGTLSNFTSAANNVSSINQCDPRNMSNYHSLQAKLTKRFSKGLQFLASYTYARSLDYGGTAAQGGGFMGNPRTITNLAAGYSPSGGWEVDGIQPCKRDCLLR
ncbi:MAG TPA: hypothetical protein VK604_25000 [Bryobacteraceae bacterium]|nr:hypothetical protein [Bryobacteraceae bacterium]